MSKQLTSFDVGPDSAGRPPNGSRLPMVCLSLAIGLILILLIVIAALLAVLVTGLNSSTTSIFQIVPTSIPDTCTELLAANYGQLATSLNSLSGAVLTATTSTTTTDSSMGSTLAGIATLAAYTQSLTAPYKSWNQPSEYSTGFGGLVTKLFGGDPLDWLSTQLQSDSYVALGGACTAVYDNLNGMTSSMTVTEATYYYDYDTGAVTMDPAQTINYGSSLQPWLPMIKDLCDGFTNYGNE